MIERIINQFIRFVVLILFQVLVLNNIRLWGYANPYLYVLFILLLPLELPAWLVMLLSFSLGLSIDFFTNTYGMHAAACVFLAFVRPYLLKIMAPRDGYEKDKPLSLQLMGIRWFITYCIILVLLHHFVLFYIEIFRFKEFFITFSRVLLSTMLSVILILLSEFMFFKVRGDK